MWDFVDLRGSDPKKQKQYCPNSIMGTLNTHPDFTKFRYMVKLANLKQDENVQPKESSMQKYLDKVKIMEQKIDNLKKFTYNDVFVKRTVFPEWETSIKQYHEKNLELV